MTKQSAQTKTPSIALLKGAPAINKAINSATLRGAKLEKEWHVIALSCLNHADLHGDITLAQRFIKSLPKSTRSHAVTAWFEDNGKFRYDEETEALVYAEGKKTDMAKAMAKPFWTYKPEGKYKPMNAPKELARLLDRAEKRLKEGTKPEDHIPAELIAKLRALIPARMAQA